MTVDAVHNKPHFVSPHQPGSMVHKDLATRRIFHLLIITLGILLEGGKLSKARYISCFSQIFSHALGRTVHVQPVFCEGKSQDLGCEFGWTRYNVDGNCYKYYSQEKLITEYKAICSMQDGWLTSVKVIVCSNGCTFMLSDE